MQFVAGDVEVAERIDPLSLFKATEFNPAPILSIVAAGLTVSIKLGTEQIARSVVGLNVDVIYRSHTLREERNELIKLKTKT